MKIKKLLFLAYIIFFVNTFCSERIIDFHSDIHVNPDASMVIEETIKIIATGNIIKRGIIRDFPTIYYDKSGKKYEVGFEILGIRKNGLNEPYKVENLINGKRIFIGHKDFLLSPGAYTYTLKYKTTGQLGFFKDNDELYWNVTGNGWKFPIDYALATVIIPSNVPSDQIKFEGYTGPLDSKEQNYKAWKEKNYIFFETTKPLDIYEGLTVVVIWPKGFVEISWQDKIFNFLKKYHLIIWLFFILLTTLYFVNIWFRNKKYFSKGTVIPLFEAPDSLTPGAVRLAQQLNLNSQDSKIFASEIVNMAVKGFLKINSSKTGFFQKTEYTLLKDKEPETDSEYRNIWASMFKSRSNLILKKSNYLVIKPIKDKINSFVQRQCEKYFFTPTKDLFLGFALFLITFAVGTFDSRYMFFNIFFLIFVGILIFRFLRTAYTIEGRKVADQIEGFKMFLNFTEKERLAYTSSPERTPEQFEEFLPYAIALSVEKNWSRQFVPIFEQLAKQGRAYIPLWYVGPRFNVSDFESFSSQFASSFSQVVASSMTPPGSSSGFGGKGGSGRGAGGGGGGGW